MRGCHSAGSGKSRGQQGESARVSAACGGPNRRCRHPAGCEPVDRRLGSCEGLEGDEPIRAENAGRGTGALRRDHEQPGWSTAVDTNTLVSDLVEDGQSIVEQLPQDGFEVMAAFWLKTAENGQWRFYI